jgi:hypothetical protein
MYLDVQRLRGIRRRQSDDHAAGCHGALDYSPAHESNNNRRRHCHVHGYRNWHSAVVVPMAKGWISHQRRHIPELYDVHVDNHRQRRGFFRGGLEQRRQRDE